MAVFARCECERTPNSWSDEALGAWAPILHHELKVRLGTSHIAHRHVRVRKLTLLTGVKKLEEALRHQLFAHKITFPLCANRCENRREFRFVVVVLQRLEIAGRR
jgi:hypothetical protein